VVCSCLYLANTSYALVRDSYSPDQEDSLLSLKNEYYFEKLVGSAGDDVLYILLGHKAAPHQGEAVRVTPPSLL